MSHTRTRRTIGARFLLAAVVLALGATGCATPDVRQATLQQTQAVRQGPQEKPFRTITGFSAALRCMDTLLIDYGVRDVSMLVEDLTDQTKKVNAGTRDMLISSISEMTRRSRAIRLVAYSKDATNAVSFLASAQRQGAFSEVPQYDIKGSISQFDENLVRNQQDLGIGLRPFFNVGASRDASSTILGIDLNVLATESLTILPGVSSRNAVMILKQGQGVDGDAAFQKFGLNFSMNLSRSEGQTQALRGLIELASVELVGRLTKIPYWTCLGEEAGASPEVRQEVADWFHGMAASRVELITWFQAQLRHRGHYQGPLDGAFNPALDASIAGYRAALGLSREAVLDEGFFTAFLQADHRRVPRPERPAVAAPAVPAATAPPAPAKPALRLGLSTHNGSTRFAPGEPFGLKLQPNQDTHVACWLQDEQGQVMRLYPNRFTRDSRLAGGRSVEIPGQGRFELALRRPGAGETVACWASERDLLSELPAAVVGTDLSALPLQDLAQVRKALEQLSGTRGPLTEEVIHVQTR
jgi:hypothetical protein